MKISRFLELWKDSTSLWLESDIKVNGEIKKVKSLCSFDEEAGKRIYENYENIKQLVKKSYFKDPGKKVSRYKRAAIIMQAIIAGKDPLIYVKEEIVDALFLKQRFAVYIALYSIIQDFELPEKGQKIFHFSDLGEAKKDEDNFLTSVYKDLFFSEQYGNFNVLTMANMLGLLVERASELKVLKDVVKSNLN